jgi:hypothetical protein
MRWLQKALCSIGTDQEHRTKMRAIPLFASFAVKTAGKERLLGRISRSFLLLRP